MVNTNSTLSLVIFVTLILIWSAELRVLALSVAAIAVAAVIAMKELIMCFTGTLYKAGNNVCSIGDWIEIDGVRGVVVDRTITATKVMEVGPGHSISHYTGKVVTIPNSLFILHSTKNESIFRKYTLHTFVIPMHPKSDIQSAQEILMKAAKEVCDPFQEDARAYIDNMQARVALETPDIDPQVRIFFKTHEEIQLICRVAIPTKDIVNLEQQIKKSFLSEFKGWD